MVALCILAAGFDKLASMSWIELEVPAGCIVAFPIDLRAFAQARGYNLRMYHRYMWYHRAYH